MIGKAIKRETAFMSKWFFALSEASLDHADHDWIDLIRTAVASARRNTNLRPHFIYDGAENAFTAELREQGVTVLHHRVTTYHLMAGKRAQVASGDPGMFMAIAAGAFLRTEIPLLEHEEDYVLYTDCDVVFLQNPDLAAFRPEYFACAPQRYKQDFDDMNSGVMVMHLPALRRTLPDFQHFTIEHFNRLNFDQDAYREFYSGRYDPLPLTMNWKPYWGYDPDATVVHFHGPKPGAVRKLMSDPGYEAPAIWRELYNENPVAYREYLEQWDHYHVMALQTLANS